MLPFGWGQGIIVLLALEDFKSTDGGRRRSSSESSDRGRPDGRGELSQSTISNKFHCKAINGIFEGLPSAAIILYAFWTLGYPDAKPITTPKLQKDFEKHLLAILGIILCCSSGQGVLELDLPFSLFPFSPFLLFPFSPFSPFPLFSFSPFSFPLFLFFPIVFLCFFSHLRRGDFRYTNTCIVLGVFLCKFISRLREAILGTQPYFIKALHRSILSKHFIQALYPSTLPKHLPQALYQITVSKHFIQGVTRVLQLY